ncbi:RHS repeat-associated core domain-containing protein [Candidatus Bathyarchaeota archaeon]|nr:RHS repeat-associated core domain-containing protein [Candidatus Bathyarchaeota archaeon]
MGNALTFAGKSCTYGAYNKLTSDGTWSYAYDGNGNLARKTSSDGKTAYQYLFNSLDQLTSAIKWTKSGSTWSSTTLGTYRYDANGMRANTTEGTTRTDYVYVGHDPWYERSKSGTTQTTTDYIYVNGGLKAKIVAGGSSPGTYFYISDALGSVRQVWKQGATSATFSVATYKPFGTPVTVTGTEKVGYAGELIDSAAGTSPGLYYIGARWMDPELGRFISLDPKSGSPESPQTLNRYVYCVNNPLRFTDPTGRQIVLWFAAGGAIWGAGEYVYHWYKSDEPFDYGQYLKYQGVYALKAALAWECVESPPIAIAGLGTITNKYGMEPLNNWMKEPSPGYLSNGPTYSQVQQPYQQMVQYFSPVGDMLGPDTFWEDAGQTFNQIVSFFSTSDEDAYREYWQLMEENAVAKAMQQRMYPDSIPFEEWISGVPSGGSGRVPIPI